MPAASTLPQGWKQRRLITNDRDLTSQSFTVASQLKMLPRSSR